jgi:hypothetical protein
VRSTSGTRMGGRGTVHNSNGVPSSARLVASGGQFPMPNVLGRSACPAGVRVSASARAVCLRLATMQRHDGCI